MGAPTTASDRRRGRSSGPAAAVLALLAALAPMPAAAELRGSLDEVPPPSPAYRVKPVEGAPAAAGVRRTLETFGAWTLICDAQKGRRVCNASQSLVSHDGGLAFSWSLAATRGGEPVFLVRAPVTGFPARTVTLDFGGHEAVIRLPSCDANLCVGFLPVDPGLVRRIKARGSVTVGYRLREGAAPVTLTASLDGLDAAIASLR